MHNSLQDKALTGLHSKSAPGSQPSRGQGKSRPPDDLQGEQHEMRLLGMNEYISERLN